MLRKYYHSQLDIHHHHLRHINLFSLIHSVHLNCHVIATVTHSSVCPLTVCRFCFRRVALRAITSQSILVSSKPRSLTTATSSILRKGRYTFVCPPSRRFASDESSTQVEPQADGATEAQHGENSIASSTSNYSNLEHRSEPPEQHESSRNASAIASAADTVSTRFAEVADSIGGSVSQMQRSATDSFGTTREQNTEVAPTNKLYIGNIFFDVTVDDLEKEFSRFGTISDLKLIRDAKGLSKGYVAKTIARCLCQQN